MSEREVSRNAAQPCAGVGIGLVKVTRRRWLVGPECQLETCCGDRDRR
jgi:hypothetical protein